MGREYILIKRRPHTTSKTLLTCALPWLMIQCVPVKTEPTGPLLKSVPVKTGPTRPVTPALTSLILSPVTL